VHASPLYIGDGLGASANRKPVPVVSPNSHDRAILHHRYDWSVAVINRVQFENHGPGRLGPGNVPAVPRRLIKGVELRFPNWLRFRHAAGGGSWDYALQAVQQEKPSTAPLRVGACLYKPLWAGPQPS
jgi:hypothetical protein